MWEATGRGVIHEVCRRLRPENKRPVAVLCAYGMLWDGRNVLRHRAVGDKGSTACWEAFREDMRRRGLNEPLLTVIDGKTGVRKAVENTLRGSLIQRCQAAFTARSYPEGLSPARAILVPHGDYPARYIRSQVGYRSCSRSSSRPPRAV